MRYYVRVGGRSYQVEPAKGRVVVDGDAHDADLAAVDDARVRSLLLDGASHRLLARRSGSGRWTVWVRGRRHEVEVVDERTHAIREMTGAGAGPAGPRPVVAPMPGLVVKVEVEVGEEVAGGDGVVIVEAMKMENELKAEGPGRVKEIRVAPGDTVEKDQVLVDFEALEGQEEHDA